MPQRIRKRVSEKTGKVTWAIQVPVGTKLDGSIRYVYRSFEKQRDAKKYAEKINQDLGKGLPVEPSKQTLNEYLNTWLASLRANQSVRPNTFQSYETVLRVYVRPFLGDRQLSELTPMSIQNLVTTLGRDRNTEDEPLPADQDSTGKNGERRQLSPRTIQYALSVLSKALKTGVRLRVLQYNPADGVELPRRHRREMAAMSPTEVGTFFTAAEGTRFEALFKLAVVVGLRPSEYLGLRWSDIDLAKGKLTVRRSLIRTSDGYVFSETKTEKSRRGLVLPAPLVSALKTHKTRQNEEKFAMGEAWQEQGLVFTNEVGGPMDHTNLLRRHFRPLLRKAGLQVSLRLYDLRHTCATLMLAADVNPKVAADVLGHASIRTTMDTYSHVLEGMKQDAAEKVSELVLSNG